MVERIENACVILVALLLALSLFPALSCTPAGDSEEADDADDDAIGADSQLGHLSYPYCDVDDELIEQILAGLTLREKIAQMYIVGVQVSPWFDIERTRFYIEDLGVGGVYIQAVTGVGLRPEWSAQNMNKLQSMALSREPPIPLIITLDQEGGIPQALSTITSGTDLPGNMALGATFDPRLTYLSHFIMGRELKAIGVNADCAPVLELMISHEETSMYTRCLGELTAEVTGHAPQAVRGLQNNLVMATAKHFPGHSTAPGDEHFMLTFNRDDEQTVRDRYLPPFIAAIDSGVDVIMTTHAVFTAWEDDLPTTFSRKITTDLLRRELGFEGLIVTDDINMGAITLHEWPENPDVLAFAAGADMVIDCFGDSESMFGVAEGNRKYPHDVAGQIDYVLQAVLDGRLSEEEIDESVRRILRTKMKYCLFINPFADELEAEQVLRSQEHLDASYALNESAITLVRNDEDLFPLDPAQGTRIHVVCPALGQLEMYPDAAWGNIAATDLLQEIQKIRPDVTGDVFLAGNDMMNTSRLVGRARESDADVLVVATYNALYYPQQIELVKELLDLQKPTVIIALAMPYDLLAFPDATTYIATYGNRDLMLQSMALALFGYIEPKGRLPVSIPGLYDVGWRAN